MKRPSKKKVEEARRDPGFGTMKQLAHAVLYHYERGITDVEEIATCLMPDYDSLIPETNKASA